MYPSLANTMRRVICIPDGFRPVPISIRYFTDLRRQVSARARSYVCSLKPLGCYRSPRELAHSPCACPPATEWLFLLQHRFCFPDGRQGSHQQLLTSYRRELASSSLSPRSLQVALTSLSPSEGRRCHQRCCEGRSCSLCAREAGHGLCPLPCAPGTKPRARHTGGWRGCHPGWGQGDRSEKET